MRKAIHLFEKVQIFVAAPRRNTQLSLICCYQQEQPSWPSALTGCAWLFASLKSGRSIFPLVTYRKERGILPWPQAHNDEDAYLS